jgi:elongation factor P
MLLYNEVKERAYVTLDGEPYEVLSSHVFRKQQRKPVNQAKLRNLITGKVVERSFHQSEKVEEANIVTKDIKYIYSNEKKGEFWFSDAKTPSDRFPLTESILGEKTHFLRQNDVYEGLLFREKIIGVRLPIKMDLRVTNAPPGEKGNTAQGGSKQATLETGATVSVPLFINEGDVVRINTDTGEYVERVEKK